MARKPRDYKAEERRRNELARQRSGGKFKTRAAQRGAIERGEIPALQPKRLRSPKVKAAQEKFLSGSAAPRGRVPTFDEVVANTSKAERCSQWAERNARTTATQYDHTDLSLETSMDKVNKKHRKTRGAEWRGKSSATNVNKRKWIAKHGKDAYTDAYYRAFVDGPERYTLNRYTGGSDAMRLWYVDITGYMSADEFERRYGISV